MWKSKFGLNLVDVGNISIRAALVCADFQNVFVTGISSMAGSTVLSTIASHDASGVAMTTASVAQLQSHLVGNKETKVSTLQSSQPIKSV